MMEPALKLKTTPPRLPSGAVKRDRLLPFWASAQECTGIAVVAPAGFGKTILLLQWRRQWKESGALVVWLSVDAQDEPTRFILALLQAFRDTSDKAAFDALVSKYESKSGQEIAVLTALLGEIALLGTQTVLMLDDAEQLPEATALTSLQYLLINAPANLHVVVASRVMLPIWTSELMVNGSQLLLGKEDLRLQIEESIEILNNHLEAKLNVHQSAKLHDAVQGWPICLQFAIARIKFEGDPVAAAEAFLTRQGDLWSYFVESLFSMLPASDADFLTRIAMLDHVNAELCEAVTGDTQAAAQLDRLIRETPLIMLNSREDWGRLHPLTRDFLLVHFKRLPRTVQVELHSRASLWFAERECFHEAAQHALAIGDEVQANTYAMKSLWALGAQGKLTEAREWIERIPLQLLAGDVSLKLAASWVFALGERNEEALQIALDIAADAKNASHLRMAALRVAGGAAIYADQLGMVPQLVAQWPKTINKTEEPLYVVAPLNGKAIVALHSGSTAEVRDLAAQIMAYGNTGSLRLATAHALVMVGLSHLWDGNPSQAEAVLRPALTIAEGEEDRRGVIPSIYASVLAAALLECGQPEAAETLLANRLDVIENSFPDIVLTAYRTLVYIALDKGDERRALITLDGLAALAKRRRLPRLRLYCLAEQIRLHAIGGRPETAERLAETLRKLTTTFQKNTLLLFVPQYQLATAISIAYTAYARLDLDEMEHQLRIADVFAENLHRGFDIQRVKVLRATAAWQRGVTGASALLSEAISLANLGGNTRLLIDTHPQAMQMAGSMTEESGRLRITPTAKLAMASPLAATSPRAAAIRQELLTAKEAQVLHFLSEGMSNKRIARALDISGETVKWHLKNLFQKLSACTRKQAIDRARLLGLVDH